MNVVFANVTVLASIFPYDPAIDSAMGHRHLIFAYCITWVVQLGYLAYVGMRWRAARMHGEPDA